jgi:hypothetical protein
MKPLQTTLLAACSLVASASIAQTITSWICTPDMATGFHLKAGRWEEASFKPSHKYVVSPSKPYSSERWELKEMGANTAMAGCKTASDSVAWLTCSGIQEFRLNTRTLKFVSAYLQGYWTPLEGEIARGRDTPFIEIGKCTPLRPQ